MILVDYETNYILDNHAFTNVFRQLDKTTQVVMDCTEHDFTKEAILKVPLFRIINHAENITLLNEYKDLFIYGGNYYGGNCYESDKLATAIEEIQKKTGRLRGNAYRTGGANFISLTTGCLKQTYKNMDTILSILNNDSLEQLVNYLVKNIRGMGWMSAYEAGCDFQLLNLYNPRDYNTFACVGHGAIPGLKLFYENVSYAEQPRAIELTRAIYEEVVENREWLEFSSRYKDYTPELCLRDIEGMICEFRKYYNLLQFYVKGIRCKMRYRKTVREVAHVAGLFDN